MLGPLPESESGNKYVLVVADYFSKWTGAFPMTNQEATTVAEILVREVVSRFEVPLCLHSDQGQNFESTVFSEMCRLLGVKKTHTTPLHPQSDGMVEMFNLTLKAQLSKFVDQNQRDWDEHIPLLLMAYHTAVHDTTGVTPAKVMMGRDYQLIFLLDDLQACLQIRICPKTVRSYGMDTQFRSRSLADEEWKNERSLRFVRI